MSRRPCDAAEATILSVNGTQILCGPPHRIALPKLARPLDPVLIVYDKSSHKCQNWKPVKVRTYRCRTRPALIVNAAASASHLIETPGLDEWKNDDVDKPTYQVLTVVAPVAAMSAKAMSMSLMMKIGIYQSRNQGIDIPIGQTVEPHPIRVGTDINSAWIAKTPFTKHTQ